MKKPFRTGETLAQRLRFVQLVSLFGLIVFALLGSRYLSWMPLPTTGWGWGYLLATHSSHYWLLSFLLSIPLFLLGPVLRSTWLAAVAALLYSLAFILMFIDTLVFDQYRSHINWLVIGLLLNDPDGQVIHFPLLMWLLTLAGAALVLHASQQQPGATAEPTTHYDLLPTLLVEALGCTNDPGVYSTGHNLLATGRKARGWFLAASYSSSAIAGLNQTVVIDAAGRYTILDGRYREMSEGSIPLGPGMR